MNHLNVNMIVDKSSNGGRGGGGEGKRGGRAISRKRSGDESSPPKYIEGM